MECLSCHVGVMQKPVNNHVAYLECNNCGAIELTYVPQDYQQGIHSVPYQLLQKELMGETFEEIQMQIIGAFGGKKSHSHH